MSNDYTRIICQHFLYTPKTVLRGKFIVLNACIEKKEKFKISYLGFYHKKLEKEPNKSEEKK